MLFRGADGRRCDQQREARSGAGKGGGESRNLGEKIESFVRRRAREMAGLFCFLSSLSLTPTSHIQFSTRTPTGRGGHRQAPENAGISRRRAQAAAGGGDNHECDSQCFFSSSPVVIVAAASSAGPPPPRGQEGGAKHAPRRRACCCGLARGAQGARARDAAGARAAPRRRAERRR